MTTPAMSDDVAAVFETYDDAVTAQLKTLRALIFRVARMTEGVGAIEETLKWGQPAYLTNETRSGTTIRLGWKKSRPDVFCMYVHCQTMLIDSFRSWLPEELALEGNRAVVFEVGNAIPEVAVARFIESALTYHQRGP